MVKELEDRLVKVTLIKGPPITAFYRDVDKNFVLLEKTFGNKGAKRKIIVVPSSSIIKIESMDKL